ncbi:MAG: hypothetical protein REI94_10640 [Moraxellaceae bacterium]|nr:hypothetical protein [Moraxellaceae bacterium]
MERKPRNHVHVALLKRQGGAGAHDKSHKQRRAAARRQLNRQLKSGRDEGGFAQRT